MKEAKYTKFSTLKDALHWIEITDGVKVIEYSIAYVPAKETSPEHWHVKRKMLQTAFNKPVWLEV